MTSGSQMSPYKIWIYILNPTLCSEKQWWREKHNDQNHWFFPSVKRTIQECCPLRFSTLWCRVLNPHRVLHYFPFSHNWETSLIVGFLKNAPKSKQYKFCFPFGLRYGFRIQSFQWIHYKDSFAIVLVISNSPKTFTNSNGSL